MDESLKAYSTRGKFSVLTHFMNALRDKSWLAELSWNANR